MRKFVKAVAIIIVAAMVITSITFVVTAGAGSVAYGASPYETTRDRYLSDQMLLLREYIDFIQQEYKDETNYETLMKGAFSGVADALGDPYSVYWANIEDSDAFTSLADGVYEGVGLNLEIADGVVRVIHPIPDSPADRAGIRSGDAVVRVNDTSLSGKELTDVMTLLRGAAGTTVSVTVKRDGKELTYKLTREAIRIASVIGEMLDAEKGIAYIRIVNFDDDTDTEFEDAKRELMSAGAKALIIDVRSNPGGLINTALGVAEQLMPAGYITYFTQQGKEIEAFKATGKEYTAMPEVLLVNEDSASASEILAAALKDSGAATLVGTNTYGKGVGQYVVPLVDGTSLKLSVFYFLSPNKTVIDKTGVKPHVVAENPVNMASAEMFDRYVAFAPMSEKVKPQAGSVGLNVYGAQQRLALLGYRVAAVNGTMDAATVEAVKAFQSSEGLYPYGVLDYGTMTRLNEACERFLTSAVKGEDAQLAKALEILRTKLN